MIAICFDVTGARNNGMLTIGVTYGYGTEAELRTAGADMICASPEAILEQFQC